MPQEKYIINTPPDRIYGSDDAGASVAVTIIRNCDFVGGAVSMHLSVDGVRRASIRSCERAAIKVTPGHHQFSVVLGGLASALGNDVPGVLELDVSGDALLLRTASTEGGVSIHRDMTPAQKN